MGVSLPLKECQLVSFLHLNCSNPSGEIPASEQTRGKGQDAVPDYTSHVSTFRQVAGQAYQICRCPSAEIYLSWFYLSATVVIGRQMCRHISTMN
jgi:hypothetical protein